MPSSAAISSGRALLEVLQAQDLGVVGPQPRQRALDGGRAAGRRACAASSSLSGASAGVGERLRPRERDELAGAVAEVAAVAAAQLVERVVLQRAPQVVAPPPAAGGQPRVGGQDRQRVGDEIFGVLDAERRPGTGARATRRARRAPAARRSSSVGAASTAICTSRRSSRTPSAPNFPAAVVPCARPSLPAAILPRRSAGEQAPRIAACRRGSRHLARPEVFVVRHLPPVGRGAENFAPRAERDWRRSVRAMTFRLGRTVHQPAFPLAGRRGVDRRRQCGPAARAIRDTSSAARPRSGSQPSSHEQQLRRRPSTQPPRPPCSAPPYHARGSASIEGQAHDRLHAAPVAGQPLAQLLARGARARPGHTASTRRRSRTARTARPARQPRTGPAGCRPARSARPPSPRRRASSRATRSSAAPSRRLRSNTSRQTGDRAQPPAATADAGEPRPRRCPRRRRRRGAVHRRGRGSAPAATMRRARPAASMRRRRSARRTPAPGPAAWECGSRTGHGDSEGRLAAGARRT